MALQPHQTQPRRCWEMQLPLVLGFWFLTSALFNDCTPRLLNALVEGGGENLDVTVVELLITVCIASAGLLARGQRVLPPRQQLPKIGSIGLLHLLGCRLFMTGLQHIPVALAQTIRAANPLFVVAIGTVTGRHYPLAVLLSLVPIVGGFALAVSADMSMSLVGVLCSVGSVMCLVVVNQLSKVLLQGSARMTSSELQYWSCTAALLLLVPYWAADSGVGRLYGAFALSNAGARSWLLGLCVLDGACYFSEQIAQMRAIDMLRPLSLAVVDTVRRLWIVVFAGFVLQGNPVTVQGVLGVLAVCGGALAYAYVGADKAGEAAKKAKTS